jgi:hypothetical protein
MRRIIFNLALLLLVVVLVVSLGAPGATTSTSPATSPAVSQMRAEHPLVQRFAAPSTLQGSTPFDAWLWFGTNSGATSASQTSVDAQGRSHGSTS